jgi:predicted DNA-binding transcriptional regulator AlpA
VVSRRLSTICIERAIRWCRRLQRTGLNGATVYRNTSGGAIPVNPVETGAAARLAHQPLYK